MSLEGFERWLGLVNSPLFCYVTSRGCALFFLPFQSNSDPCGPSSRGSTVFVFPSSQLDPLAIASSTRGGSNGPNSTETAEFHRKLLLKAQRVVNQQLSTTRRTSATQLIQPSGPAKIEMED